MSSTVDQSSQATGELSEEEIRRLLVKPPAWRRRDVQRSTAIAVTSTVVVVGVLYFVITRSRGWKLFQEAFLSPSNFALSFPQVLDGFWLNVRIFMIAESVTLVFALLLALARNLRGPVFFPVRAVAIAYTDLFRGIPEILVIMLLGLGMPALRIPGLPTSAVFWGTIAIILTSSAYTAETYRAGIESIHTSQRAAARSLGLTNSQALRYIILPQAIRRMMPPLITGFIALQKGTALISVVGPLDAVRQAQVYTGVTYNFTSYVAASALFVAITIPLTRFTDYLLARTQRRRSMGGAV